MGGAAHGGRRVTYDEGMEIANKVIEWLKPYISRWQVCGSLRRKRPTSGDVDLVVVPKSAGSEVDLNRVLGERWGFKKTKPDEAKHSGLIDGVQVDCSVCDNEMWGARIMHLTGSVEWNVMQRSAAKKKGMLLNEKGLWKNGKLLASRTEEEVYKALGQVWTKPEEREDDRYLRPR